MLAGGVELRSGQRCGRDFTVDSLLGSGYRAVLLAVGLQQARRLALPGAELPGVIGGLDLLRRRALGDAVAVGRRVVVIGGGDVAVDAARTALRLGAERVTIACIEDRDTLPAQPAEIAEALAEGIELTPSLMPVAILGEDAVTGVRFQPCTLGERERPRLAATRCRWQAIRWSWRPTPSCSAWGSPSMRTLSTSPPVSRSQAVRSWSTPQP